MNLLLGGVIGLILVGFDLFVRDKVLEHRELFDRIVRKVAAYAANGAPLSSAAKPAA